MIVPSDVLAPKGRVELSMFSGETTENIEGRVALWLVEGDQATTALRQTDEYAADRAILAWAYHRAFDAASVLMDSRAATISFSDSGTRTYLHDQIKQMRERAQYWLAQYNLLVAEGKTIVVPPRPTMAVRTQIGW